MPQEKIIINFKAVGAENLTRAIRRLDDATRELQNKAKRYGKTSPFSPTNSRLQTNALATIRSKLLLLNFAMAMGIRQTIEYVKQAAKVEQMANAFNTLSGGVENATVAMDKLQQATNGTMSEFDLFQQANNALILGVSRSSDEMAEMFDIAQRLGRALGRDTASSVESLITGIGRQSRLMLDNIGIMVNAEGAYKAFAETIGVNVDMLTDTQKKQAFLNATMSAAREKVGRLGDELINTQDAIEKVTAGWTDATAEMGKFAIALFNLEVRLPEVANHLRALNKILKGQELALFDTNAMWINFAQGIETWLDPLGIWTGMFGSAADNLRDANAQLLLFSSIPSPMAKWAEKGGKDMPLIFAQSSEGINQMSEGAKQLQRILAEMNQAGKVKEEITARQELLGVLAEEQQKKLEIGQAGLAIAGEMLGQFNDMTSAMSAGVNARMKNEMDALKATSAYQRADGDKRKAMEKGVTDSYAQERTRLAKFEKASNLAQAGINIATAITKVLPNVILASLVAAMGAVQIGAILDTPIPKFAQGGMIGGRRHSAGGTMINAEAGEFIMSRSAVQSVGIDNLNRMNEGGGGGSVTVNVSGNVLTQDFVEGELAENIKEAIRRGTDFGIS